MPRTVLIDCFARGLRTYPGTYGVVVVDVLRAMTTAVTGLALGRRCFPIPSLEVLPRLRSRLAHPLLVGELRGGVPVGFDLDNSPAQLAERQDTARPMVLLSTSGTRLLFETAAMGPVYAACLRNVTALVDALVDRHPTVLVIGAGSRGEFREEDQLCCARIAGGLVDAGYEPAGETESIVRRWGGAPVAACTASRSVAYLRSTGRGRDVDFTLHHVDDLTVVPRLEGDELVPLARAA
jgi:2-phosphosulfolactate phosphatase